MAEKLEIVVTAQDKTGRALGGIKGKLRGLGDIAKNAIGFALGGALMQIPGLAMQAAGAIGDMVNEAARVEVLRGTFERLAESIGTTADALLTDMRQATRGMVADADLMQAANKFVAMGLADTQEEAAQMAEMATQLGMAMGEDATGSMENFALLLANQSIPRLDSFGISSGRVRQRINELMETTEGMTREQAFLTAVMEQGTLTMEKVGEQSGGAAGAMARLKAGFENAKIAIGQAFLPIYERVLEGLAELVEVWGPAVADFVQGLGGWFQGAWAVIQPILGMFSGWFGGTGPESVFAFSGSVQGALGELMPLIKDLFAGVVDWVQANWPKIQATVQAVMDAIQAVIQGVLNAVIPFMEQQLAWIVNWVVDNWPLIQATIQTVMDAIQAVITTILSVIQTFWAAHGEQLMTIVNNVWTIIKTTIGTAVQIIFGLIKAAMQLITGDWQGAWETIQSIAATIWDAIQTIVNAGIENVKTMFQLGLDAIKNIWAGIGPWFRGIGASIVSGLKSGIQGAWDSFIGWIISILGSVKQKILEFFGVGSPSKVFAEIGANLMEGLAEGIGANIELPVKASAVVAQATTAAATGAGTTHNWNVNINTSESAGGVVGSLPVIQALATGV